MKKVKFYEFIKFPYYALICARSNYEALGLYISEVCNLDDDDAGNMPDEITIEQTIEKCLSVSDEDEKDLVEFYDIIKKDFPSVILISGELI